MMKLLRGHRQSLTIIEVAHVHLEGTVILEIQQVIQNLCSESWFAIGRQAH